ncbi:MAG: polyprenyl synthetase family protein [Clostridiales bacterium]|nr:polyprenyl synthetase family protein [Clostridiales bacterium]HBM79853.1 farnesyl-diphosphate synthase [Clostridiaceae bacterium]
MDINKRIIEISNSVGDYLKKIIPSEHKYINTILNSMRYSTFAGGKRLRPVLMIGSSELFGCPAADVMPFAASIEMIHTYSLIHDDLPAMDNDDYRRGKLSNHKVFGEGMAILTGDALLNFAFENMVEYAYQKNQRKYVRAAFEISRAAGIYGMIGGQVVDLECENKKISEDILKYMYNNKTGALIKAAIRSGAIIAGAGEDDIEKLTRYGENLGFAFQIVDDILDVIGDRKTMGKETGSDEVNKKATYVSMHGIKESMKMARFLSEKAMEDIDYFGQKAEFLKGVADLLLSRNY